MIHFDVQWCLTPAGGADHVVAYIQKCVIEELEEQPLDLAGNGKQFTRKPMNFNDWSRTVTANVIA